jgi:Cu(I)/Ag(I) efflux system membrane fusion protein
MKGYVTYLIAFFFSFLWGCRQDESSHSKHNSAQNNQEEKIYTCPMHRQIIRNEPGQCPICGMNLVEKKSGGKKIEDTALVFLLKPTNEYVISGVKSISPKEMRFPLVIDATGIIGYDTRKVNSVSARVTGRIENLYVKYRFQNIAKGQKLFDIYSPELVTEQENFLYLIENDTENDAIIKAAETKLSLLGLTQEQINEIKQTKNSFYSISVYSPYAGHLHETEVMVNHEMTDGMIKSISMREGELTIKEGMYVEKGQVIFNIYDTKQIWALFEIYPEYHTKIKTGQKAMLIVDNTKISATIDFIEPVIRQGQKFLTIRCYVENPDRKLKIGTRITGKIFSDEVKAVFVPASSVLSLGQKRIVFIKEGNLFRAKEIITGTEINDWIEIAKGIDQGAIIAFKAQLLMDSESFIKVKK